MTACTAARLPNAVAYVSTSSSICGLVMGLRFDVPPTDRNLRDAATPWGAGVAGGVTYSGDVSGPGPGTGGLLLTALVRALVTPLLAVLLTPPPPNGGVTPL